MTVREELGQVKCALLKTWIDQDDAFLELASQGIRAFVHCKLPESDGTTLVEPEIKNDLAGGSAADVEREWQIVSIADAASYRTRINRDGNSRQVLVDIERMGRQILAICVESKTK